MQNCLKEDESDVEVSYYKPGFVINYSTGSSSSLQSSAESKPQTPSTNTSTKSKASLNPAEVAERCRIGIEGRGGMVSIEGHGSGKKSRPRY